jgi:hypothetical protein
MDGGVISVDGKVRRVEPDVDLDVVYIPPDPVLDSPPSTVA